MTEERPSTPKATHNPYHPVVDRRQFQTPDTATRAPETQSAPAAAYENPQTQPRQPFLYGQLQSTPSIPKYVGVNHRSPPSFGHHSPAAAVHLPHPAVSGPTARVGAQGTIRQTPTVGFPHHPTPAAAAFWPLRQLAFTSPAQKQPQPTAAAAGPAGLRVYQPSPQVLANAPTIHSAQPVAVGSPATSKLPSGSQTTFFPTSRRRPSEFPNSPLQPQSVGAVHVAAFGPRRVHSLVQTTDPSPSQPGRVLDFDGNDGLPLTPPPVVRVKPQPQTPPVAVLGTEVSNNAPANFRFSPSPRSPMEEKVTTAQSAEPDHTSKTPSSRKQTSGKRRKRRVRGARKPDGGAADAEEDGEGDDAETTAILMDNRLPKGTEKGAGQISSPEEAGSPTPANDRDADNAPELDRYRYYFTLVSLSADQMEACEKRLSQRKKQLFFGHQTEGYQRYRSLVSRSARELENPDHPVTPRADYRCSKRSFDVRLAVWRRALHSWDDGERAAALAERNPCYPTLADAGLEPFGVDFRSPDDPQGCAAFAPSRCASTPAIRNELATPSCCGSSFAPLTNDPLEGSIVLNDRVGAHEGRSESLATPVVQDTPDTRSPVLEY